MAASETAEKAFAEVLYEVEARVYNIETRDQGARVLLQAYANVATALIDHGYKFYAEGLVEEICKKAEECGFQKEDWLQRLKKRAGIQVPIKDLKPERTRREDSEDEG